MVVHNDSATNWDAPAYTSALISSASITLSLDWCASTPNTMPIANPLMARGMVRLAPRSTPQRVNVTCSLVASSLTFTFAFCTVMNLVIDV